LVVALQLVRGGGGYPEKRGSIPLVTIAVKRVWLVRIRPEWSRQHGCILAQTKTLFIKKKLAGQRSRRSVASVAERPSPPVAIR